jgi:hypothetical protein
MREMLWHGSGRASTFVSRAWHHVVHVCRLCIWGRYGRHDKTDEDGELGKSNGMQGTLMEGSRDWQG